MSEHDDDTLELGPLEEAREFYRDAQYRTATPEPPWCEDCAWHETIHTLGEIHYCSHAGAYNFVMRKPASKHWPVCYHVRGDPGKCGLAGRWFKAREEG